MNRKLIKWLVLPGLLFASLHSQAGSPRGLRLLVLPSEAVKAHLGPIDAYFQAYDPDGSSADCGDSLMNIEDIRFADKRHNITPDLAIAAITNSRQRARLAKALAAYRDKAHPTGFDGALIVDAKSGQIELFGFSADGSEKPYKATIPLSALDESSRLQRAMCRALGQLPALEAP